MLHHLPLRQKIVVMAAVMGGLFLAALDQTIITTALGRIVEEFNSFSSLSWIITAYLITSTITVPLAGKLSDMFGRRNLLMAGVALFTVASFLSGTAQSIEWLTAARALQGVGGGILTTSAFTIVGDLFNPRERGKWQGMVGAVFGLSSVVGPLLGGYLTDAHNIFGLTTDWRWTFYINIPIGILAFVLVSIYCPNFKHEVKHRLDWAGAGLLTLTLGSLILATENTDKIFASVIESTALDALAIKVILWTLAVIAGILFVLVERKAASPILPMHLFKRPAFRLITPVVLLNGAAFIGAILYLTQFLQQVLGASATEAGLMLIPMIFALVITSTIAGRIISRLGRYRPVLISGIIVTFLGILSLTMLNVDSTFFEVAILMIIVGIGLGSTAPIYNVAVQNEAEQKELGVVTSSVQLSRGLGSTIGAAILGGVLTTGVAASLGNISEKPLIQALKQQPAASQQLGKLDADTALQLNTPEMKKELESGIRNGTARAPLPERAKETMMNRILQQQKDFSREVKIAFSDSLHTVFLWAAGIVGISSIFAFFIKETPLKSKYEDETPGL